MSLEIVFHCPNFEKVKGLIASGLSIHLSVHHAYLKPLARIVYQKSNFLISQSKHMFWDSKELSQ